MFNEDADTEEDVLLNKDDTLDEIAVELQRKEILQILFLNLEVRQLFPHFLFWPIFFSTPSLTSSTESTTSSELTVGSVASSTHFQN